jgi:uncharacterized membrane protein
MPRLLTVRCRGGYRFGMAQERSFDRLVNFSDAVVAIAATLLILPLVDKASSIGKEPVGQFLANNVLGFVVFALSFFVIARFWLAHHRFFDTLKSYNRGIVIFDLLWLLGIVFIPFPTELIISGGVTTSLAASVYIGTMLFISLAGLGMSVAARRDSAIVINQVGLWRAYVISVSTSVVVAVALVVCLLVPQFGLWALWLLFALPLIVRFVERHRVSRDAHD